MIELSEEQAVQRARELVAGAAGRVLLGIAGSPGAGKSHLAATLLAQVPGSVVVGMDAFHLAHSTLTTLGTVERKGAPDTFDAAGYVGLLRRIRDQRDDTIWAPEFRRDVEDAIAGAVAVRPEHRLVVTEGNYLLLDQAPWNQVPPLCDEVWFVDPGEQVRVDRLVARHVHYGRSAEAATLRAVSGTDGDNARLVAASRSRADAVVVSPPGDQPVGSSGVTA